jgi:type II secretory pathway predicted ATPase ExeA
MWDRWNDLLEASSMRESGPAASGGAESSAFEEALARCEYLVTRRRPLGLVYGTAGCGHSELLDTLANRFRHDHDTLTASVEGTAIDRAQLVSELALSLDIGDVGGSPDVQERAIHDRLAGLADCGRGVLVCLHHLDEADPPVLSALARLLRISGRRPALTVIASAESHPSPALCGLSREFGFVRIELSPWSAAETADTVVHRLRHMGGDAAVMDADILDAVRESTHGPPRDVERLCELLELARSQGDELELTADGIRAAAVELCNTAS